jgi:hypothetical protein
MRKRFRNDVNVGARRAQRRSFPMRKAALALSVAAAAMLSTAASAQPINYPEAYPPAAAATAGGVVTGTVLGVGVAEGWFGGGLATTSAGGAIAGGAAGAATLGGVAGIGTVALIHSVTTPCHGFLIGLDALNPGPSACGQPVAEPARAPARRMRRIR